MRNTATLAFILVFCAAPIFAEPGTEPAPEQTPVPPISPDPAPRSAGFHKGALIFSLMGGPTLRASNSFMNQENAYDQNLNLQVQTGNTPIALGNTTYSGPLYTSRYRMQPIIQFDYERALSDHFGLGFSIFNFSIDETRQDVRPGFRTVAPGTMVRQDYVLPYPTDSKLFMSTGGMLQAVFHPLSTTFIDPYMALRGGIEGHSGNAHPDVYPDPFRYDNRIRNGVGFATGAALGVNLYMSRYFGFKFEATGLRQFLKSDTYSARTMDSAHFQIGIFLSLF